MKFIAFDKSQPDAPLSIAEVPEPELLPGTVRISVAATSLNRADLLIKRGQYGGKPGLDDRLGLDAAGTVIEVAPDVREFSVGDNVCALLGGGGFAQQIVVDRRMVLHLPERLSFTKAAAIPEVFLTAYQALYRQAKVRSGEYVLIHAGASGVGTAAIQLALKAGAIPIVTASGHKHQALYDLGARHCINYREEAFDEAVLRLTNGHGADVTLDVVGAPYYHQNFNCAATDSRLISLATLGGRYATNLDTVAIVLKRLTIIGTTLRNRSADYKADLMDGFRKEIWPDFHDRKLLPVVDTIYDWEDVNQAVAYMESNANVGKLVITIGR